MSKIAIVILAGTEGRESGSRVTNALTAAKEMKEAGKDVKVFFDGAGTAWIPELEKEEQKRHKLYMAVKEKVSEVCSFCAESYNVKEEVAKTNVKLSDDYMVILVLTT